MHYKSVCRNQVRSLESELRAGLNSRASSLTCCMCVHKEKSVRTAQPVLAFSAGEPTSD